MKRLKHLALLAALFAAAWLIATLALPMIGW